MVGLAYQVPASPSQEDSPGPVRSAVATGLGAYAAVAETHSAVVFFVGDRAYKLKKPVTLGFLDFTRPRARAAACRCEMTLNRRFAPDVYLGVAAVHGPDGRVCDHLVVMRRMPAARRLSALVRAGADVERPVARVLAAWHAIAPRSRRIAAQGTRRRTGAGGKPASGRCAESQCHGCGLQRMGRAVASVTRTCRLMACAALAGGGWSRTGLPRRARCQPVLPRPAVGEVSAVSGMAGRNGRQGQLADTPLGFEDPGAGS